MEGDIMTITVPVNDTGEIIMSGAQLQGSVSTTPEQWISHFYPFQPIHSTDEYYVLINIY